MEHAPLIAHTAGHGGLLAGLLVAGLVGGFAHCIGMCGPFVVAQTVARLEALPAAGMREFHRLAGAALIPYHLGRMTTYTGLGAGAALLASELKEVTGLRWISSALLVLAALFFLGYGLRLLGATVPWAAVSEDGWWSRRIGRVARPLFERPLGWRGYGLGVALGFLPCGMLYGAIAAAASAGVAVGALAMLIFALGTVPGLVVVGLTGHVVGVRWRGLVSRVAPAILVFNAGLLAYTAWRLMA